MHCSKLATKIALVGALEEDCIISEIKICADLKGDAEADVMMFALVLDLLVVA